MISLDLTKSSEVRIAGDQPNYNALQEQLAGFPPIDDGWPQSASNAWPATNLNVWIKYHSPELP